jgi:RNA-binding protein YlmH
MTTLLHNMLYGVGFMEGVPYNYPLATEKKWAAYFWSLLIKASEQNTQHCTHFADPRQQDIARDLLHHFTGVKCSFFGGYPEAERVRVLINSFPAAGGEGEFISCLALHGNFPERILTHRDFLGALLGLGIKREMLGDIIYTGGEKAYVFLVKHLASFVCQNLTRAGRYEIKAEEIDLQLFPAEAEPRRTKDIKGTVASMRLDTVAGLGFGLSRSKIVPLIKGERVKVNHQLVKQPSKAVKTGDIISLAGRGRIEITEEMGISRKGRTHLLIKRFY